jgi:hypothetical protein
MQTVKLALTLLVSALVLAPFLTLSAYAATVLASALMIP